MARVSVTCLGHSVSSVNATRVCCSLPVGSVWEVFRRHVVGLVMDKFLRTPGWSIFSVLCDGFLFIEKMAPSSRGALTS